MKFCTYIITNNLDGKIYIGYTKNFLRRSRDHFREKYWESEPNKYLYNSMKAHGKENFSIMEMAYHEDKKIALKHEVELIKNYKDNNIKLYNETEGGESGGNPNPLNTENEIQCSVCHLVLPIEYFNKDKYSPTGHIYVCKKCIQFKKFQKLGKTGYTLIGIELNNEFEKWCNSCKTLKLRNEFHKSKHSKDGLTFTCKKCQKEAQIKKGNEAIKHEDRIYNSDIMRECNKCEISKPLTPEFWTKNKRHPGGLFRTCKICKNK